MLLSLLGVAKLMRFIPRSVMIGFVNALAILIFLAQLPHLIDVPVLVYPLVAIGLAILFLLPRLTTIVPAPLVAIVVLTAVVVAVGWDVPTVGDEGALPDSLPALFLPNVPLTTGTTTSLSSASVCSPSRLPALCCSSPACACRPYRSKARCGCLPASPSSSSASS